MKTTTLILLLFATSITMAQFTAIPDTNFEQKLIKLGHDDVIDGQVLTASIENVGILILFESGIEDLTGIEDFTNLQFLLLDENELTFLDVSQNTNLIELTAESNPLETLLVSNNPNLTTIYAGGTELIGLDTSACPELISLGLDDSKINTLNLNQNPLLTELYVSDNFLIELDLSQNPDLEQLSIGFNPFLKFLDIKNGNTSNITNLDFFQIAENHCIQVDDAAAATAGTTFPYNKWQFDEQPIVFSENCELNVSDLSQLSITAYPNPTNEILHVNSNETLSYTIFSIDGKLLEKKKALLENKISLTHLNKGIYFITFENKNKQVKTLKIIKQ